MTIRVAVFSAARTRPSYLSSGISKAKRWSISARIVCSTIFQNTSSTIRDPGQAKRSNASTSALFERGDSEVTVVNLSRHHPLSFYDLQQNFKILQRVGHAGVDIAKLAVRLSYLGAPRLEDLTRKELRPAETAFARPARCGNRNSGTFQGYHERFVRPGGYRCSLSYRYLEAGIA